MQNSSTILVYCSTTTDRRYDLTRFVPVHIDPGRCPWRTRPRSGPWLCACSWAWPTAPRGSPGGGTASPGAASASRRTATAAPSTSSPPSPSTHSPPTSAPPARRPPPPRRRRLPPPLRRAPPRSARPPPPPPRHEAPEPPSAASAAAAAAAAGPRKRRRVRDFEEVAAALESRWPVRRLRFAAEVIVGALAEGGGAGRRMTRQEVRDAARLTIGDTGLIDFVLKSLGDCAVGGRVVRRAPHPLTRVLEFSLEDPAAAEEDEEEEEEEEEARPFAAAWPSQGEVERAVGAVYWGLVEGRREAAQAVLDCKHWAKRWGLGDEADDRLRFLVRWKPPGRKAWEEAEAELSRRRPLIPPGEVVVVEAHAAVGELVAEAERAMRDTYCAFERFVAEGVDGVAGEEWEPVMNGGAESGAELWVRGEFGAEAVACELRREGGEAGAEAEAEAWAVACACGASDDDGERMVACDACDVWHHTRCAGIADGDPVPPVFSAPAAAEGSRPKRPSQQQQLPRAWRSAFEASLNTTVFLSLRFF
uniref:Uncharacterized protein n=1 Tax=Ananas comosus var. bracteatus TaxID=296719 RepID=A0A6V7PQ09_ANACO|nr:unnamed protein product [Ananas comosus var. bracteatus]